jgi:uncharacterized membrane-anchored protein
VQFVANLGLTFAQCNSPPGRWELPVHGWQIVLSAVAVAIGLAAMGVSLWLYRLTFRLDHVAGQSATARGLPRRPAGSTSSRRSG